MKESDRARDRRFTHKERMRLLRPRVLERDGYRCVAAELLDGPCASDLHAHHRYRTVRTDTMANLVTLCSEHHQGDNGVHNARMMSRAYDLGLLLRESDGPPTVEWKRPGPLDSPLPRAVDFW